MQSFMHHILLFAENAANPAGPGGANPAPGPSSLTSMLVNFSPFIVIGLLFYWLLIRPQRQEQSKRQDMLGQIKKNDRVVTIGGIYGVVTNLDREADEVTIKVDESSNTKLRVQLSAISRVVGEGSDTDSNK